MRIYCKASTENQLLAESNEIFVGGLGFQSADVEVGATQQLLVLRRQWRTHAATAAGCDARC